MEAPPVDAGDGARLQVDTEPSAGHAEQAAEHFVGHECPPSSTLLPTHPPTLRTRRRKAPRQLRCTRRSIFSWSRDAFKELPGKGRPTWRSSEDRVHPRCWRCYRRAVLDASERQDARRSSRVAEHACLCWRHHLQHGGPRRAVHLSGHMCGYVSYLWPFVSRTMELVRRRKKEEGEEQAVQLVVSSTRWPVRPEEPEQCLDKTGQHGPERCEGVSGPRSAEGCVREPRLRTQALGKPAVGS